MVAIKMIKIFKYCAPAHNEMCWRRYILLHSGTGRGKLFQVDGVWSLIGSANLDPRSLRLNFELDLELYDPAFTALLEEEFVATLARSREVSLAEMDGRPLPEKVRDSLAKLFSPYM